MAIQLKVLGRKRKNIIKLRRRGHPSEAFRQIIVVMKKYPTGCVRKFSHHVVRGRGARQLIQTFYAGDLYVPRDPLCDLAARHYYVQATRIQSAYRYVRTHGVVNYVIDVEFLLQCYEARR